MITVSRDTINPYGLDLLTPGRSRDIPLRRDAGGLHLKGVEAGPFTAPFLAIVHQMAPPDYTTGVMFCCLLPPMATNANETHRDKDNAALNFVAFVTRDERSIQHEFFEDLDFYEQRPIVTPNNHVIMFTKDLHRRPARPAGEHPKMFLTASLYRDREVVVSDEAEPYECHGGVM